MKQISYKHEFPAFKSVNLMNEAILFSINKNKLVLLPIWFLSFLIVKEFITSVKYYFFK